MSIAAHVESPPAARRWGHHAATRFATIGDQLLVALSNFALTVSIGRAFGAEEVASYGIGLSAGLMIQALQRHAILIPLMLQPAARVERRRGGIFAQHGLILAFIALSASGAFFLAYQADIPRFATLIVAASGVCLLLYAQLEFARSILVKLDRPWMLFASAAWYAAVSAGLAWGAINHALSYEMLLGGLAASMVFHALALFALAQNFSLPWGIRLLLADMRRYGNWSLIATLTYSGYNHLPLFILGALTPPVHAAAFVATRSLLQPLQILLRGLDVADKAMFSQRAGAPYSRKAFRLTMQLALLYACAAGLFGVVAGIFANDLLLIAYGEKFAGFGAALLAWIPVYALMSVSLPFESLVYARQTFRGYYLIRALGSVVAVALTAPLILPWAEVGAIAACGAGSFIAVAGTVILLLRKPNP
jgi:O-antigen/teichoic acid export membrane protein